MSVSFVRPTTVPDILLGRMTTGDLDLSRVPFVLRALEMKLGGEGIPMVTVSGIGLLGARLRRTRRGRTRRLCGQPLTDSVTLPLGVNPTRLTFRALRRLRNPCPWINAKPDTGLEPPTMRGPDPPDKKCRMCDRDIPDPSKIEECKICMKRACEICIPKATRLCPVCALSIGSSQVPQHLFGTGGGGYSSHHDPNCTAATKCIAIDLPPEPDAAGLRVWIANMKEAVSNAYSYDGLYVINWLTEVEKAKTFDELDGECKYHILEARFNAAIRKCIKTVASIDKINRLTEAAQLSNNRIKSRQILWLLYDHLRTANIGEQSFRIIELSNLRCSVSSFYTEEERLERFIAKWDHILAGLDEPLTEQVKRSLFSEKVRHLNCLAQDIREWDRNISNPDVCSYEWLRARCKNEIDRWRVRKNQVNMQVLPLGDDLLLEIPIGLIGLLAIRGRGPVIPLVLIEGIGTLPGIESRTSGARLALGVSPQGGPGLRRPAPLRLMHAGTSRVDTVRADKSANSHTQELGVPMQNARSVLP